MIVQKDIKLSTHTTIKIGGKAKYFVTVHSIKELKKSLLYATRKSLPSFIISGGSNTIFSDEGYQGVIIKTKIEGTKIVKENKKSIYIKAFAGTNWDTFVKYCVDNGYQGIECLSGIPGSVGATPIQNVGAYGQEVSQTVHSVECIDKDSFKKIILSNQECKFSYRDSFFKGHQELIITSVIFKLRKLLRAKVNYPQVIQKLSSSVATLSKVRSTVIALRKEKSMILDLKDPNTRSVGSFFKNPIVGKNEFNLLQEKHGDIPFWNNGSSYKISAAWLIEMSGFTKGYNYNPKVGLSTKHTLAVVNKNHATSSDLVMFVKLIQEEVYKQFSIQLIPEPILVGIAL
jgi:UDP-N-acetylmuramate dehydrogenase